MHDWTLLSIQVAWETGQAELTFRSPDQDTVSLVAKGLVDLHVPKRESWGPSVSVNQVEGPSAAEGGLQPLEIEMQSGDRIRIVAASFRMPPKA